MANHDPISDMLTRIRNASEKRHEKTKVPASRMSLSIAKVLQREGLLQKSMKKEKAFESSSFLD